jgi:hypothetical protein
VGGKQKGLNIKSLDLKEMIKARLTNALPYKLPIWPAFRDELKLFIEETISVAFLRVSKNETSNFSIETYIVSLNIYQPFLDKHSL